MKRSVNPDQGIIFPLFFFAIVSKTLKQVVPTEIMRLLFCIALFIMCELFWFNEHHSSCILCSKMLSDLTGKKVPAPT